MNNIFNFNKVLAFISILCFCFASCEKEQIFSTRSLSSPTLSNELAILYRQMPVRDYSSVSVVGDDILRFKSITQYKQICKQLKDDCVLWDSLFTSAYARMTTRELFDWMDSVGYNEYLPIIMFENALGVQNSRLFDYQQTEIEQWTENEFAGDNPTDKIFIYEWEQALYNKLREVCIGDTIYQFREDATITISLDKIKYWLEIRKLSTKELSENENVTVKGDSSDGYSAFEKVPFKCYDKGEFNATNMPELFSGLDYSFWIVIGKTGFWGQENRLDSKLVNYALHKIKKNGKKVFKKVKRNCCIEAVDLYFYKEQFLLFENTLIHTDIEHCRITTTPTPKFQTVAKGETFAYIDPAYVTNKSVKYKRGVFQHPVLYIHIDGNDIYPTVTLKPY